jgi:hypothetical protein
MDVGTADLWLATPVLNVPSPWYGVKWHFQNRDFARAKTFFKGESNSQNVQTSSMP